MQALAAEILRLAPENSVALWREKFKSSLFGFIYFRAGS
jgi:hypothetical protein